MDMAGPGDSFKPLIPKLGSGSCRPGPNKTHKKTTTESIKSTETDFSLHAKYSSNKNYGNLFSYDEKTWRTLIQNDLLFVPENGQLETKIGCLSRSLPRSSKSQSRVKEGERQTNSDLLQDQDDSASDDILVSNGMHSDKIGDNGLRCSVCGLKFANVAEQRDHFKMDWHRYNLKRKLLEKPAVTESDFQTLATDKSKDSNMTDSESESSDEYCSDKSSGEQDDDDDDENCLFSKHKEHIPRVYFVIDHNEVHSVYRFLLMSRKSDRVEGSEELMNKLTKLFHDKCWIILMLSAGHFAAAVFHRKEVIEHKAIHRYTVRAKRGTSQSVRDSKQHGHAPRSAGANIRRYNETALLQDIQDLLSKWKDHIEHCDKIFVKWPGHYKSILFGGKKAMLDRTDERIRKLPIMTKRPSFKEVKRVHTQLSKIRFHETLQNDDSTSREIQRTS